MRSSMLILLFLIGVQAAANMGGEDRAWEESRPESLSQKRTDPWDDTEILSQTDTASSDSAPTVDPELFNSRQRHSARVLFSTHPPESEPGTRVRRHAAPSQSRGVYSVCDSVSAWVGNKTRATDISGNDVTVLPNVNINNVVKKQYFFETMCRAAKSGSSGCLGVDARHWNSHCTNTHTFVRALTSFNNLVAWRLIRINVACVCVLSRKSWRQ
ncbi:nerve growth factor [Brienomyrus brachyistius]|uniref:nerve growth factor n=1 Tax=Brienomyrus brachyistius TaxID=42636 RepID=UPI0020B416B2|nr:nerve growth factor [Brienomyrus brachyistius]